MNHEHCMRLPIESARTVPSFPFVAVIVRRATGDCLAIGANCSAENPTLISRPYANDYSPASIALSVIESDAPPRREVAGWETFMAETVVDCFADHPLDRLRFSVITGRSARFCDGSTYNRL